MTETVAGEITGGAFGNSVTAAADFPAALIAVTVSVPDAGIVAGAVYKPADVTVPTTAVQLVAPGALNCCVPPTVTDTAEGEIVGGILVCNVTVADDDPPRFDAVTVSVPDAGITLGAV
jgi:hypothetical protein